MHKAQNTKPKQSTKLTDQTNIPVIFKEEWKMEIRKQEKEYRKKLSVGALVLGLVALSMTADVRDAWADPHGIFYTAIGQQQLFFNVLAALDQADYVETAFDREARRKAREAVSAEQPFAKETESGGRFTKETEVASDSGYLTQPGTPTLLNRAVTLDGADLYTDQLVREFGAESARRNAAAELLQTLCAYGFGINMKFHFRFFDMHLFWSFGEIKETNHNFCCLFPALHSLDTSAIFLFCEYFLE